MDTVTQALLGATIAQTGFSQKLGRRAIGWGALGGVIPDLDLLATLPMGTWGEFLYHRGITHSLGFGLIVGPLLGWVVWLHYAKKQQKRADLSTPFPPGDRKMLKRWIGLFVLVLFTHPLLDLFTTYGTQLLAPFSNRRFALDAVPIVDPAYSLLLIGALLIGSGKRRKPLIGISAGMVTLLLSTLYLFYGLSLNREAERMASQQLAEEGIVDAKIRVHPTLLQVYLRRVVVWRPNEIRVGYLSLWRPHPIIWEIDTPPQHRLIEQFYQTKEAKILIWFARGEVAPHLIEDEKGAIVELDDIRYGFRGTGAKGLWGIRGRFDPNDRLVEPIKRFHRPLPTYSKTPLSKLLRAIIGLPPLADP